MKVVYTKSIADKVAEEIAAAAREGKTIERIELDYSELGDLWNYVCRPGAGPHPTLFYDFRRSGNYRLLGTLLTWHVPS